MTYDKELDQFTMFDVIYIRDTFKYRSENIQKKIDDLFEIYAVTQDNDSYYKHKVLRDKQNYFLKCFYLFDRISESKNEGFLKSDIFSMLVLILKRELEVHEPPF